MCSLSVIVLIPSERAFMCICKIRLASIMFCFFFFIQNRILFADERCDSVNSLQDQQQASQKEAIKMFDNRETLSIIERFCNQTTSLREYPSQELLQMLSISHYYALAKKNNKDLLLSHYPALWSYLYHKKVLRGHLGALTKLHVTADNKKLISGGLDASIIIWNLDDCTKAYEHFFGVDAFITTLHSNDQGDKVIAGSLEGEFKIFDISSNLVGFQRKIHTKGELLGAQFLHDDRHIIALFTDWLLFMNHEGTAWLERNSFALHDIFSTKTITKQPHIIYFHVLDCAPRLNLLAYSDKSNAVQLRRLSSADMSPVPLEGHRAPIHHVLFSPDQEYLASTSSDNTVRVWHTSTYECRNILRSHEEMITGLTWLGSSLYLASIDLNNNLIIWNRENNQKIFFPLTKKPKPTCMTASRDGKLLAFGDDYGLITLMSTPYCLELEQLLLLVALRKI